MIIWCWQVLTGELSSIRVDMALGHLFRVQVLHLVWWVWKLAECYFYTLWVKLVQTFCCASSIMLSRRPTIQSTPYFPLPPVASHSLPGSNLQDSSPISYKITHLIVTSHHFMSPWSLSSISLEATSCYSKIQTSIHLPNGLNVVMVLRICLYLYLTNIFPT